jgi:hypothetical protein
MSSFFCCKTWIDIQDLTRNVRHVGSRLFLMPMGGGGRSAAAQTANSVSLTSESWLGREPSYQECQDAMGKVKGIFDNGC